MGGLTLAGQSAMAQSQVVLREERTVAAAGEEQEFQYRVSRTTNAEYYASDGQLIARGPRELPTLPVPLPLIRTDRFRRVPGWSVTYDGVKIPLYDLKIPEADLADPYSYRGYISRDRFVANLESDGYSDIYWFPFKDEDKAALKYTGALYGSRGGKRFVLVGVRVVAE